MWRIHFYLFIPFFIKNLFSSSKLWNETLLFVKLFLSLNFIELPVNSFVLFFVFIFGFYNFVKFIESKHRSFGTMLFFFGVNAFFMLSFFFCSKCGCLCLTLVQKSESKNEGIENGLKTKTIFSIVENSTKTQFNFQSQQH